MTVHGLHHSLLIDKADGRFGRGHYPHLRPRGSSGKSVYRCDAGWEHWRRRGAGVRTDVVHGCQRQNTPYKDKMILYAAVVVQEGTGDYVGRRSPLHGRVMGAEGQWNRGVLGCVNDAVRQATFVDYCSGQEASIWHHRSPPMGHPPAPERLRRR